MKNKERGIGDLKAKEKGSNDLSGVNSNLFFDTHIEDIKDRAEAALKPRIYFHKYRNKITGEEKMGAFLNPKRGNKIFADETQDKFDRAVRHMKKLVEEKGGSILQMTLTGEYDPTNIDDIFNSWERMKKKYWPLFYRWVKRKGFSSYISTNEAFENGGCHTNVVIYYKNELEAVIDKDRKSRLADKKLEREIKNAWRRCSGGIVDIQVVDDLSGATGYISKEMGRESAIEGALKRSIQNWENESDKKKRDDIKKLNGWYIAEVKNLRRWNMSRDLSREVEDKVEALDNIYIANSTETITSLPDKRKIRPEKLSDWERIEAVFIPSSVLKKGFFPKLGWIDNNSPEYALALRLFYLSGDKLRIKIAKRLNERKKNKSKLPMAVVAKALAMAAAI